MAGKKIDLFPSQKIAMLRLNSFIDNNFTKVFILCGYAGTGKTTLMNALIDELKIRKLSFNLLASTGRAAKILSNATNHSSTTVHGLIYKYKGFNQNLDRILEEREKNGIDKSGQLLLNFELTKAEVLGETNYYIVDEASMISDAKDKNSSQAIFGTGRLLTDLLSYDPNGKFIFVGDTCQLPPISQTTSPALSTDYFNTEYNMSIDKVELTEIVRQAKGNDIIIASQKIRRLYINPQPWKWAKFPLKGCKNIHVVESQAKLLQLYIENIKKDGFNDSTIIGFTNKQCDTITNIIRPAIGIKSTKIAEGDLLLVTQNNYLSGLMNGDLVEVKDIGERVSKAGLTFLYVTVKELFSGKEYSQLIIEEILYGNQTNLSQTAQKELFIDFYIRMKRHGIGQRHALINIKMMSDPYLNALRCVYGYALTCHKAQGGEWNNVYLDLPRNISLQEKPYVYQWVYTAMTRAKKELYVADDFFLI